MTTPDPTPAHGPDEQPADTTQQRPLGPPQPGPKHVHALVVGTDADADEMATDLDEKLGRIKVDVSHTAAEAVTAIQAIITADPQAMIPLVIVMDSVGNVDDTIDIITDNPIGANARYMLMTARESHDDIARAIDANRLVTIMSAPWIASVVTDQARVEIEKWLSIYRPDRPDLARLVGAPQPEGSLPADDLISGLEIDSEDMVKLLIDRIEHVLGPRPRINLPAGVRLTRQGESLDAVYLVLKGAVSLHRSTPEGDVLLHHASSGPIIGLVSFAQAKKTSFTSLTTSDVTVVRLSIQQLERVLASEPVTSAMLAVVAIKALARRLIRAEALHIENELLATKLEEEKQHLAQALKDLEEARAQLVGQARYAMLGELAAGIAHELNNPVAAIIRAGDYVSDDIDTLLQSDRRFEFAHKAYTRARTRPARSTSDERKLVRTLNAALDDRAMAKRLVKCEIDDPKVAKKLLRRPKQLELVEAGAGIGNSVRNIHVAAKRITDLVRSLRSYARPDNQPVGGVDVAELVEETVSLISHRVKNIELERDYAPDLPTIKAYPGQLTQVWTNLIVNAAEAIEESGVGTTICIRTEAIPAPHSSVTHPPMCTDTNVEGIRAGHGMEPIVGTTLDTGESVTHSPQTGEVTVIPSDVDWVRVSLWDNGPGVDPKVLPQIFEPRFTTKSGTVRFGLGMGLGISRQIVENHGGFIFVDSRPGCTGFVVDLPVDGPPSNIDNDWIREGA